MSELILDMDEGIILSEEAVIWTTSSNEVELDKLILTNKNIYMQYEKSNGLFANSTDEQEVRPLSEIKIINGRPMVDSIKDGLFNAYLQIQSINNIDKFEFYNGGKKKSDEWVKEIYTLLVGSENAGQELPKSSGSFSGLKDKFASAAQSAVGSMSAATGSAIGTVSEMAKQAADNVAASYENTKKQHTNSTPPLPGNNQPLGMQPGGGFCSSCGSAINPGTKFCPVCGNPVDGTAGSPAPQMAPGNPTARQQQFAGMILKCPNCGAQISQTTAICPECGFHITGQAAVSSVQNFANQLMALESKRKGVSLGQVFGVAANPIDTQKLALIQSFPIPNTVDDIQEFIMLAIANIDTKLSKHSIMGFFSNNTNTVDGDIAKKISDAWVSKMQQAYQKALAAFPDDSAFQRIKKMYTDKMSELNIAVK